MNKVMDLVNTLKNFDIYEQYRLLKDIITTFLKSYREKNSWKLRLIDCFIVYCFLVMVVQLGYVLINGKFPMNSIVSGIVCCLGSITLAGI
jgi:hypothetical protein